MTRTWKIQMNLDEFNALCGVAFTEADRSALLGGLQLGCNAGTLPEGCSSTLRAAYEVGMGWRMEAEGYKARRSEGGKASAEARKAKYGTAVPNSVRTVLEVCSNQSTIHNPLTTNTPPPPKKKRTKKETTSIPDDILPEVVRLCAVWPRQSIGDIGPGGVQRSQDLRAWSDPVDLYEHWLSAYPTVEPAILAACGTVYLEGIEYVEDEWTGKKTPKYCYAMRNFYGQKEYWKLFKGAALERLKDAIR